MLKKISLLLKVVVLAAVIAHSSGRVYKQCFSNKPKYTKVWTTSNRTRVTQIKTFESWWNPDRYPPYFRDPGDFVLAATYDQLYMFNMKTIRDYYEAHVHRLLIFKREPKNTHFISGHACPNNEFGRIRLDPDSRLEVCGSICGKQECRFYHRDQFKSSNYENSEFNQTVNYAWGKYAISPRHEKSWLETEKIGDNKTFVAMNAYMYTKDLLYKNEENLKSRYRNTQRKEFDKESNMDFKKIIDRAESKKVLTFFNELSDYDIETGESVKTNYAKVAQVCKNDESKKLNSYLTLPFHCSIGEGKDTLYFNKLISVSDPIKVKLGADSGHLEDVVFATMGVTYSYLNRTGSVVTMIKLSDVEDYFDNGDFTEHDYIDGKSKKSRSPIPNYHIAHGWENKKFNLKPLHLKVNRPGNCQEFKDANEREMFEKKTKRFFRHHKIRRNMFGSLKTSKPLAQATFGEVYTSVTAVSKKGGAEVIVGSSKGKLLRIYVSLTGELKSFVYEEVLIPETEHCKTNSSCNIVNLTTVPKANPDHIVGSFDDKVIFHEVDRCSQYFHEGCESKFACEWYPKTDISGDCKRVVNLKDAFEKFGQNQIDLCKSS